MNKEIRIGALLLITIAISIWGYMYLKGKDIFNSSLNVSTVYSYVDQLAVSSPVLINGVKVGNVTEVSLDPENIELVRVKFIIEGTKHVPKSAFAELKSSGIMGNKVIEVTFDKACSGDDDCLEDGDVLRSKNLGLVGSILGEDVNTYFDDLQEKFNKTLKEKTGDSTDLAKSFQGLKSTISNLDLISQNINNILSSSASNMKAMSQNIKIFSDNLVSNNQKINQVVSNIEKFTNSLDDIRLDDKLDNVNLAVDEIKSTVGNLKTTIDKTNATMDKVRKIAGKVENGDGSLGVLLNEDDLVRDLEETNNQIKLLLQDIRLNPKRYINVSVFGKKQKEYSLPTDDPAAQ